MASFSGGYAGGAPSSNKITKPRAKLPAVKPILKKLAHSEKNSLDLDRPWEDQTGVDQMEWGGNGNYGSRAGSTKDVTFSFGPGGIMDGHGRSGATGIVPAAGSGSSSGNGGGVVVGGGGVGGRKFGHGRSASQASTGSTSRGTFVHPFQQTPRTSTPPLSYANSLASFDNATRDYSPTITENDDDELTQAFAQHQQQHHPPPSQSQPNIRRPSLASQRTSSFSDITAPAGPLRVATGRSTPTHSSKLALGSLTATASYSDLHLNLNLGGLETSNVPTAPSLTSPTSSVSVAAMSPIRSSLEGFRLRSKSELDAVARAEQIRVARRKFEERERAKEEKYDREMIKKRERRDNKQATKIEKGSRKVSSSEERPSMLPISSSTSHRPGVSRKTTPPGLFTASASAPAATGGLSFGKGFWGSNASRDALQNESSMSEKPSASFASRQYESVPAGQTMPPAFGPTPPAGVDDVRFEQFRPRRSSNAKRRTQSYWQGFLLWLRTRILRLSPGR